MKEPDMPTGTRVLGDSIAVVRLLPGLVWSWLRLGGQYAVKGHTGYYWTNRKHGTFGQRNITVSLPGWRRKPWTRHG